MNKYKIILPAVLLVAAGIVVFLIIRGSVIDPAKNPNRVRVAAILNLTGPSARFDADKKKTLELALVRLKELYPKFDLEFKLLDAGGGPESTTVAVRQARAWEAKYLLSGTSPTALT